MCTALKREHEFCLGCSWPALGAPSDRDGDRDDTEIETETETEPLKNDKDGDETETEMETETDDKNGDVVRDRPSERERVLEK